MCRVWERLLRIDKMAHSKEYVEGIIDQHDQIADYSCVPSSVEMALKLLKKVPLDFYEFQKRCDPNGGCFTDFDGKTISGVTFHRINLADRGVKFPFKRLFDIIDQEIEADRYVMVALVGMSKKGRCYHGYVIFGKDRANNDYYSVTKASSNDRYVTQFDGNIKNRIIETQGTDILIYSI